MIWLKFFSHFLWTPKSLRSNFKGNHTEGFCRQCLQFPFRIGGVDPQASWLDNYYSFMESKKLVDSRISLVYFKTTGTHLVFKRITLTSRTGNYQYTSPIPTLQFSPILSNSKLEHNLEISDSIRHK